MKKVIQKLNYTAFFAAGFFIGLAIQFGEEIISKPKPVIYFLDLNVIQKETGNPIEHPIVTLPETIGYSSSDVEIGGKVRIIWQGNAKHSPAVKIKADGYREKLVPIELIQRVDSNSMTGVVPRARIFELEKSNQSTQTTR